MQLASRFRQIAAILCVIASGCATPPAPPAISTTEQVRYDTAVGGELARQLEPQLKLRQNPEVSVYLRQLAENLVQSYPASRGSTVGVLTVQDKDGHWRSFSLPGNRIYLSVGLLKSIEYENELAAALALEIGHLLSRHAIARFYERYQGSLPSREGVNALVPPQPADFPKVEYFGPAGVLTFSEQAERGAIDIGVKILYHAGFDPRGMSALLAKYAASPAKSPYEPDALKKHQEQARRSVAEFSPLLNPIVRSQAFLGVQKRFKRL